MKNTPEENDKIALCNIRKILQKWNSQEYSLQARIEIDAELDKVNI